MDNIKDRVVERFLKYVSFETTSSEDSQTIPSSSKELELGKYLKAEFEAIGMSDVRMDDKGYVYAVLPANTDKKVPCIGFISHMDTSPDAPGRDIKPQFIDYKGGDIVQKNGDKIAVSDFPFLEKYIGQQLIITDGTTLLGADDKAGVAEIVTAMEYLIQNPQIKHGRIAVGITPDEEIGCGADYFDVKSFGAEFAYTVDGGALGELEYENFNAAAVLMEFKGLNIHPGSAKNKMKNAALIASEFVSLLPPAETPAHTEGYEGFYHIQEIHADETSARIKMLIRDHNMDIFKKRKETVEKLAEFINFRYGEGTAVCRIKDSYYNMKEKILPVMHVIDLAEKAMKAEDIVPVTVPIRGGTDGARLSFEGLPCPNLSTGGENFHSVREFVSVPAMKKMVSVIVNIASIAADQA